MDLNVENQSCRLLWFLSSLIACNRSVIGPAIGIRQFVCEYGSVFVFDC